MKHLAIFCALTWHALSLCTLPLESNDFQLIIEPTWQNLERNTDSSKAFGGKWVLIGSITFKKKSKDSVELDRLELKWHGEKIDDLAGSLYRKSSHKDFMPIEDYLICDGTWNKAKQTLKLTFDQQQTLGFVNTFYLVLTIPDHMDNIVKHGAFDIVSRALPEPFRVTAQQHKLSLSLDALDTTTHEILH